MASLRSTVMNSVTRILMGWLCRRQSGPVAFRELMQKLDQKKPLKLPSGISISQQDSAVPGRWVNNVNASGDQYILYLHGGAFIMRMPQAHSAMVAEICRLTGRSAFMPWYRLAPEHLYPAAPEDCLAAYRCLLDQGVAADNIVVMGDSAGGNLALSLLHLIKANELAMPAAAVMLSPVLDLAQLCASWRLNIQRDPMYRVQALVNPVEHYLPAGSDLLEPTISPCYGDFSGFPPLLSVVGDIECLLDDSVGLVKKAVAAGVASQVQIWQGMPHVFMLQDYLPESRHALAAITAWIASVQEKSKPSVALYRGAVQVFRRRPLVDRVTVQDNQTYHSHAK